MALTDVKIRQAKPGEKPEKLSDEKGLYLLITPPGFKTLEVKISIPPKGEKLSLGAYPDVSLAQAREMRDEARNQLTRNIDPGALKQANKQAVQRAAENTFESIAREWHAKFSTQWTAAFLSPSPLAKAHLFLSAPSFV